MKKVVLLAPLPPPHGGIASWTQRMVDIELPFNWEVAVVDEKVLGNRTVFGKDSRKSYLLELKRCLKIWIHLIRFLFNRKVLVVQACIPAGPLSMLREIISGILTKFFGKKFVVHFRCTLPYMVKGKLCLMIFKCLMFFCDEVFVLNNKSAEFMKNYARKKKIAVIPNFISNAELKEKNKVNSVIKTVVYSGGVIPEKGCDLIIKVAEKLPTVDFRLIGKIGIDVTNIPSNVTLLGEQNRLFVQKELSNADVFLFMSRFLGEGFSNALAEAMANSLPCVGSDWAANSDMIDDSKLIVENDVNSVLQALKYLESEDIRKKIGAKNCEKVKNFYSEQVVLKKYVVEYESLIK